MAFKSKAQRRKLYEKVQDGSLSKEVFEQMERETKDINKLPEYAPGRQLKTGVRRPQYIKGGSK